MEGLNITLKNKRRDKKYIKVSTPESRKAHEWAMIYTYDGRLCLTHCKGISLDELREIGYGCFYWLTHDDKELEDITFEGWADSMTTRMEDCEWFDTWKHCNKAIDSYNTYKKYL